MNNEVLRQLYENDGYSHERNHDILEGQFVTATMIYLFGKAVGVELPKPTPPVRWVHPSQRTSRLFDQDQPEHGDSLRNPDPSSGPSDSSV